MGLRDIEKINSSFSVGKFERVKRETIEASTDKEPQSLLKNLFQSHFLQFHLHSLRPLRTPPNDVKAATFVEADCVDVFGMSGDLCDGNARTAHLVKEMIDDCASDALPLPVRIDPNVGYVIRGSGAGTPADKCAINFNNGDIGLGLEGKTLKLTANTLDDNRIEIGILESTTGLPGRKTNKADRIAISLCHGSNL